MVWMAGRSPPKARNKAYRSCFVVFGIIFLIVVLRTWVFQRRQTTSSSLHVEQNDDVQHSPTSSASVNGKFRVRSAVIETGSNAQGDSLSGFSGEHIFHVTNQGRTIEGVLFLRGPGERPLQSNSLWESDGTSGDKSKRYLGGNCFWCERDAYRRGMNRSTCLNGTLYSVKYGDDHEKTKWREEYKQMELLIDGRRNRSYTVYFLCQMDTEIRRFKEGVLRADNLDLLNVLVNPRPTTEVTVKGSTAVCVKSFYGSRISDFALRFFLKSYLDDWKVDKVVFFEQSMTRGFLLKDIFQTVDSLKGYYQDGRVIIIDHRAALQRLYGAVYQSVTFFSAVAGQILDMTDCRLRAKIEGYEWVLSVDLDEIVSLGPDLLANAEILKDEKPFSAFLQYQEKLFDSTKRHTENILTEVRLKVQDLYESDACTSCNTKYGPFHYPDEPLHEHLTTKYAVRFNVNSFFPRASGLSIHYVAYFGAYDGHVSSDFKSTPSTTQAHIRHYKCLNRASPCDMLEPDYPDSDAWAQAPV